MLVFQLIVGPVNDLMYSQKYLQDMIIINNSYGFTLGLMTFTYSLIIVLTKKKTRAYMA